MHSLLICVLGSVIDLQAADKPSLVVVVSVDQLSYEYLERFESNYLADGLANQARTTGVWFTDCKHQHAITKTGPGHAVQLTGTYPNRHGIIGNSWYDRASGRLKYCVADPRAILIGAPTTDQKVSPRLLLADTVGDQLKLASRGRSKVFTIAIKDRAAILMAGRLADSAVWMSNQGAWISCDHYGRTLPKSIAELNARRAIQTYAGKSWQPLLPMAKYQHGEQEQSEHERPQYGMTKDFPHQLPAADQRYYINNLACSPFGNAATLDAARALIVGEELGQDEYPDILGINLSPNDYVGHSFGPDSLEVEDMCYRTDKMLGKFVAFIRKQLGDRKFVLFVTADHGVAPVPEQAVAKKLRAGRNPLGTANGSTGNIAEMETQLEAYLQSHDEFKTDSDDKVGIVQAFVESEVFLNHDHPALTGWNLEYARRLTRDWVMNQPFVVTAMTRDELLGNANDSDLSNLMRRSYHPKRSGDVMYVLQPFFINGTAAANHGSPWHYDRHVPLLVVGDVKQERSDAKVSPASIATTISRLLRVEYPSLSDAEPLREVKLK
ncbi:MAG: alkaline phosphatase family protein [Planctomycetaceae bacterium]